MQSAYVVTDRGSVRGAWWLALLAAVLLPAACSRSEEEPPESEIEELPPAEVLEAGEAETVLFAADGFWQPTTIKALGGQRLTIRPAGESAGWDPSALGFRIGSSGMDQHVTAQPFIITRPGRIFLRAEPRYLAEGENMGSVRIHRLE